jgi:hypothetical protein
MKVTAVSASIRYSKSLGLGEHKTVELSANADLEPGDDWFVAQQNLYTSLGTQLRTLWGKNGALEHAPDASGKLVEPPQWHEASSVLHGHYCQQHQTEFKYHEKGGRVWYSHKLPKGWCNER